MREDMFKVIVERPRRGRRHATKTKIRYDSLKGRSHVTGRRLAAETGYQKHLNENLAPLKRYLHKQVGRKWDDVFSEICQHLDTGSTVKMHVREHLDDFICRNILRDEDGKLWASYDYGRMDLLENSWVELYVDPDTGLLKRTRHYCAKQGVTFRRSRFSGFNRTPRNSNLDDYIRPIEGVCWYMKLKGIWYFIELSNQPKSSYGYALRGADIYKDVESNAWQHHVQWSVVRKVQLSRKALKTQKLQNDLTEGEDKL